MPLPTPNKGEKKDDFMARCMSDDTMKKDYEDNKQRVAVCMSQWRRKNSNELAREIRATQGTIELEERDSGLSGLKGYAAVYWDEKDPGSEFRNGKFVERILPGAFSRAIREKQDIVALFNHDESLVLGRRSSKTLRLWEDEKGLRYSLDMPNTSLGRDLLEMVSRGDIQGNSFSFAVAPEGETWRSDGPDMIRELRDVSLFDIGPVTHPAYQATVLSIRSQFAAMDDILSAANQNSGRRITAAELYRKVRLIELEAAI
jgi:Escherichia/Staphylococcus phage prohead protease